MSFGASPSDIIIVVTFCKALYRKCRDASGEYDEISREVKGLHTVLRHLNDEVEAAESPLNQDRSLWGRQLAPIIRDCDSTLHQLDELLQKYGRLSSANEGSPTSPRGSWDRVRFGSNEMDQLGALRVKMISHKTNLTPFLGTIQLHESRKVATTLDSHSDQLDAILDKVDTIAARIGAQKSGSIMTTYDNDDKEVWKDFKSKLVAEGFSSKILQQHKDVLQAYIREIDQNGLLDEVALNPTATQPPGIYPQQWLNTVEAAPSERSKCSIDSLKTLKSDESAKEMVFREDNMKFPTSMKFERLKPVDLRGNDQSQSAPPQQNELARTSNLRPEEPPSPVPQVKLQDKKTPVHFNGSESDDLPESDTSSRSSEDESKGAIIRTSDLLALNRALQVRPAIMPSSLGSNLSYGDNYERRSIEYLPQNSRSLASSPSQAMTIPIRSVSPGTSSIETFGASPRPESFRLAPDSQGNQIPSDAKWTKINRRLVSPEVLDQDRRRYEARPDFVAVLGVLSRKEIEDYARRSQVLRDSRVRRGNPPPSMKIPTSRARTSSRDEPSSEDESTDSDGPRRQHRRREHRSFTPSVAGSDVRPHSGYPNAKGAPISPISSIASTSHRYDQIPRSSRDHSYHNTRLDPLSPEKDHRDSKNYSHVPREHHHHHRHKNDHTHASQPSRVSSHSRSNGDREKERDKDKGKKRWRENLAAAGIGGAAASLLNVLTEAAEGL